MVEANSLQNPARTLGMIVRICTEDSEQVRKILSLDSFIFLIVFFLIKMYSVQQ